MLSIRLLWTIESRTWTVRHRLSGRKARRFTYCDYLSVGFLTDSLYGHLQSRYGMKNFALIGLAGYIAPRHLEAISATGNRVVAAFDPHDSVGVADRFFPDADFFTEFERFDRHAEKLRRLGEGRELHYVTICSPNYLHDSHIRFALRSGAHAVCEKPLVLNPWNLDALEKIEEETGKKVYTLLQLRYQPDLIQLKNQIAGTSPAEKHEVELTYITGRGKWLSLIHI